MARSLKEIYAEEDRKARTFLTAAEVARRLGLSPGAVYLLIRNGTLPAERVGRAYLIRESDLPFAQVRRRRGRPRKEEPTSW